MRTRAAKGAPARPHLPEAAPNKAWARPEESAREAAAPAATEAARAATKSTKASPRPRAAPRIEQARQNHQPGMVNAKLIYAAYLTSPALPIAALAAFGVAHYARRRSPPAWLASHYTYQIRTFWGALAGYVASLALAFAGGGLIIYPLVAVWLVARSVHGIVRAAHAQQIDDPEAFLV